MFLKINSFNYVVKESKDAFLNEVEQIKKKNKNHVK